ncbi:MAG: DUF4129 domain-containing protein, partial [Actinomycetota bacterium]
MGKGRVPRAAGVAGIAFVPAGAVSQITSADVPPIDRSRLEGALEAGYRDIRGDPSWFEQARRFLGRALTEFSEHLSGINGAGSVIAWLVVAALVVGIFLLLRRLSIVPERRRARPAAAAKPPVDWARIAEEALARGDIVGAIRARFRVLIGALSERGVVVDEPSLTAGECRRAVRSAMPGAYLAVSRATEVFELAAYAHAALKATDVDALREA